MYSHEIEKLLQRSQTQSPSTPCCQEKRLLPSGKCGTSHHQGCSQSWPQQNEISGTTTARSHHFVCQPLWHSKLGGSGLPRGPVSSFQPQMGCETSKYQTPGNKRPLKGLLNRIFSFILTHFLPLWPETLWIITILRCPCMYDRIRGWWKSRIIPTHCCNVPWELIPEQSLNKKMEQLVWLFLHLLVRTCLCVR